MALSVMYTERIPGGSIGLYEYSFLEIIAPRLDTSLVVLETTRSVYRKYWHLNIGILILQKCVRLYWITTLYLNYLNSVPSSYNFWPVYSLTKKIFVQEMFLKTLIFLTKLGTYSTFFYISCKNSSASWFVQIIGEVIW